MEKDSLLNLFFLLIFCLVMGGFFVVYDLGDPETVPTTPIVVTAPIVPATPDWIPMTVIGRSMEPWVPTGSTVNLYPTDVPAVGDMVVFECRAAKCLGEDNPTVPSLKFLRRVDSRGCFWFEGRLDRYLLDGEYTYSFDSTEYGYLCASDLKVLGVVRDLPEEGKH